MSSPSHSNEDRILDPAMELFIRHGFRRTTMGDIAKKADMSRPALYLVYRNKEEIFRAVVLRYSMELEQLGCRRIAAKHTLAGKLDAVMQTWVVDPYKMISHSPEAGELHEIAFSFGADLRKEMHARFENQLLGLMNDSPEVDPKSLKAAGTSPAAIASLIARATPPLKRTVASLAELERHLATMKQLAHTALTMAAAAPR
ncbi:MAG: TetR/AcrR family transcriptional regulator [Verrucomicrobiales bacterium]|nr:helix-turn-helix domain-containing protein [Verrucomicrobiota bacterium JB025]